jgi:GNAT superfamily N-acetyltransferase
VELHIELDAVIFDDGTLVGAGESALNREFAAYVSAKQNWYRSIVTTLDTGGSLEEAFRPLDEFRTRPMERLPFKDPLALWTGQGAGDLSRWRHRHGDAEAAAMARRALRKEPFVIYRTPILFDIRKADPADIAAIAEAHLDSINTIGPRHYGDAVVRVWGARISGDMYERAMARGEIFFIAIAHREGRPEVLGFSSHHADEGEHRTAVYVRGAAARHGVGSALFRTAEAAAIAAGASSIHVDASYAAVEFYKANGFEVIGDGIHRLESGETMPCVLMRKTL